MNTKIDSTKAMGQSIEGYLKKVPMEARWEFTSSAYITTSIANYKTLYDQGGKEKLVEYMKERGRLAGTAYKGLADRFGFTGNDVKSAAGILPAMVAMVYGPQQKFEIEEAAAQKARVKCTNCAFWNNMQKMKITDDLCSALSHNVWSGRGRAINPKLTVALVKARPLGDSACEWVFELKA